jgi:hypothetical protein
MPEPGEISGTLDVRVGQRMSEELVCAYPSLFS